MHNSTDQDVMDLYSTPSNTTASSLMDAYLNPEFQYSLQLATLNHHSNSGSITATPTAPANSATTTTVPPPTSSFDLFWELSSPSFENNVPQMLQQQQSRSKPSLPLLPDKSESESNSVTLARAPHQEMNSNVSKRACSTPLLKYHRSVSQLHQAASSQRPSPTLPIFNHRASLPNIYPVNGDGGYANQHSSSLDTFTSTPSGNSHNSYNSHYLTASPTTWDQGLPGNRHHPRSASTFDESTRKRTKSMDNMNDKQSKGLAQQYYQTKQLDLQQNHPQFHLQHGKQQQYLYPTQQYHPNSVSSTISVFSIDGSAPALEYPNDSANVAFYPAYWYHKQFFHGISSVSGQPFTSPLEQRINKETDLLEGLCHQCLQFVPICNTKRKNSVLWYRHAHKCHIYDKPKSKSAQQP
ncbi:hypothetical protein [Absidia glauca]|uniref:Transcription regulator Rua1 C-terminal domain-containing protein n=1 Tax=Absidia glauca TaxID=4829 RepID=A0A168NXW2_ABSGL|nr:hypothetical protein [Absidia glauca]